jgi:hypothetical protein
MITVNALAYVLARVKMITAGKAAVVIVLKSAILQRTAHRMIPPVLIAIIPTVIMMATTVTVAVTTQMSAPTQIAVIQIALTTAPKHYPKIVQKITLARKKSAKPATKNVMGNLTVGMKTALSAMPMINAQENATVAV